MPVQLFTNNAASVLTTGISNVSTSLVLTDGSAFPSPTGDDYFLVALIGLNANGKESSWEIVKCTGRTTNTLTVVRAQEGTTAVTWGVGTGVELRLTASFGTTVTSHLGNLSNPHVVTKAQVGLGNVDNTSDANKPVSTAQATANTNVQNAAASDATTKANAAQAAAIAASAPIAHVGSNGTAHTNAVAGGAAGFMSGADKTKLDAITGTNTGDSAVNSSSAPSSHVGAGGTAHAVAVSGGAAGFMSGADKTKLDGIATGATNFTLPVATTTVLGGVKQGTNITIDGTGTLSASIATNLAQGVNTSTTVLVTSSTGSTATLTAATSSLAGVMNSTDKAKLDAITGTNTGDQTTVTGNAGSATVLQTARTINGVSFNGSTNITINAVDATARVASSLLGAANGVATLDGTGKIPSAQLPAFVDDVLEYTNLAGFPATGSQGVMYVALDTNKVYRWSGSTYIFITSGAVDSVAGKTGVVTLVKGDVGLGSVDNTTDVGKPVSTAQSTAIGLKIDTATKDASNGVPGLTLFKLNLRNAANTITSWFTTAATVARTWTLPDKDGTIAMTSDITGVNSGTNTGDNAVNNLYSGLVTNATHTGDVTGATALTIAANAVTNAKAAQMAVNTIKGRITAGTGNSEDLTAANVRTIINVADGANNYVHPTGDSNSHVPATGTTSLKKALVAGATANTFSWETLDLSYLPEAAFKKSVVVATTANIGSSFLSGVLTGPLAVLVIDGVTVALNDRILVKDQTAPLQNGIYYVSTLGTVAIAWVLTRVVDANTSAKIAGALVNVDSGTNAGYLFDTDFRLSDTLNTTGITWNRVVDTGLASTVVGATPGTAAIGTSLNYARQDHVHPAQTSIVGITGTLAQFNTAVSDADLAPIASPYFTGKAVVVASGTILPASTTMAVASTDTGGLEVVAQGIAGTAGAAFMSFRRPSNFAAHFGLDTDNFWKVGGWSMGAISYKLWHEGCDGAGSGLDADLLDGQQGSYYQNASNLNAGTLPAAQVPSFLYCSGSTVGSYLGNGLYYNTAWKHLGANSYGYALRNSGVTGAELYVASTAGTLDSNATMATYTFSGLGRLTTQAGVSTTGGVYIAGLATPGQPTGTPSTTGGTIAAGTHFARIVALDLNNAASIAGVESAVVTTTGSTSSIVWSWPAVTGAAYYLVFVGVTGAQANCFTATTNSYTQTLPSSSGTALSVANYSANFSGSLFTGGNITAGQYMFSVYLNMSHASAQRDTDNIFFSSSDNYVRKNTATGFKTSLALQNVTNESKATMFSSPVFTGAPRAAALSIGADSDLYLYEGTTDALTVRHGAAGAYRYTTFKADGNLKVENGTLEVATTTLVTNLNADLLDGAHVGTSGAAIPLLNGTNTWGNNQTITVNSGGPALSISNAGAGVGLALDDFTISSTALVTNLNADMVDGYQLERVVAGLRANRNINGGGIITVNATGSVHWNTRFLVMSNGNGAEFATSGYFDIICPTSGTVTGVGGAANVTATAAGIPLTAYQALYYILPIGSAFTSVAANFRIAIYNTALSIPSDWVLICVNNGDAGVFNFPNGVFLKVNESLNTTTHDARNADLLDGQHGSFYQAALVSGTSIKTVNGSSLLGSGNLAVGGGLVLLATVTPTAAANLDFLSTFSSTYDNYLIVGSGITLAADEGINIRLAVAGAADAGSNYVLVSTSNTTPAMDLATNFQLPGGASIRTAGKGCNFQIEVLNANDTGRFKALMTDITWNDAAGVSYSRSDSSCAYIAANAVTGFRLYSTFGGNFAATGKIRVYGYANT